MKTRKQYMAKECTHREYYGQFVTKETIARVVRHIGKDRLLKSADEHLNDIPLELWDMLPLFSSQFKWFEEAGDWVSLSSQVCVNKEAARQFIEREKAGTCTA